MMRHASGDAPRIKGTFFNETVQEAVTTECATHQVKSTAGNALNDKLYSDAPRINRCAAHRNLALPEYKRDWGELFSISLPIFPLRNRPSELVQRSDSTIFHTLRGIQVVRSCSSSSESTIACFYEDLKAEERQIWDFYWTVISTGFSVLFLFFSCDSMISIVRMMFLVMIG